MKGNEATAGHDMKNVEEGSEEEQDESTSKAGEEAGEDESEQGGTAGADGGAEGEEAGEAGEEDEGEAGEEDEGVEEGGDEESVPLDADAFKKDILGEVAKLLGGKKDEGAGAAGAGAQPPKQRTEEEWTALEESTGMNRKAITAMTKQSDFVYQKIMDDIDSRFARFEKSDAINSLSKDPEFSDVHKLRPHMDEFLGKFDVSQHSNPELLKMAAVYARGLGGSKNIKKVRHDKIIQKKVVGAIRSPKGTPPGKRVVKTGSESASHKSVKNVFGMSDEKYNKLKEEAKKPLE